MNGASTFVLYTRPFLDTYSQCYKNIVTINVVPRGPLARFVRRVQFPRLSVFKEPSDCCARSPLCGLAIGRGFLHVNNNCGSGLMNVDEIPDLFSFLLSHGYKIDTSLTKMINSGDVRFNTDNANKIICFVNYLC